jgi:protein-arginine kinase activator protein McsA
MKLPEQKEILEIMDRLNTKVVCKECGCNTFKAYEYSGTLWFICVDCLEEYDSHLKPRRVSGKENV